MRKLITIACTLMLIAIPISSQAKTYTKAHTFERGFEVGANPTLGIDHRYGHVTIIPKQTSRIEFKVTVTAKSNKEQSLKSLLEASYVNISHSGTSVTEKTTYVQDRDRRNNSSVQIDMEISVPLGTSLRMLQRYGNIYIEGDVEKNLTVELKYGNMHAKNLLAQHNDITLSYGNLTMANAKQIAMDLAYGAFSAENVDKLRITTRYSKINANKIEQIRVSGNYNKVMINELGELIAGSSYSHFTIGTLSGSLSMSDIRYGGVSVDKVLPGFGPLVVYSKYTDVDIKLPTGSVKSIDLESNYTKVRIDEFGLVEKHRTEGNNSVKYYATAPYTDTNQNSASTVTIRASYGRVSLRQ